jgi:hypothetical protein
MPSIFIKAALMLFSAFELAMQPAKQDEFHANTWRAKVSPENCQYAR